MTPKRIKRLLEARIKKHVRKAWRPITSLTQKSESWFGGLPILSSSQDWPVCKTCNHPMKFFLQLDLASVPENFNAVVRYGLVQLFCCDYYPDSDGQWNPCNTMDPFSGTHELRFFANGIPVQCPNQVQELPRKSILGWEEILDTPGYEDLEDCGIYYEFNDEDEEKIDVDCFERDITLDLHLEGIDLDTWESFIFTHSGDKLGGWPYWSQRQAYPKCPECHSKMELLMQIGSEDNLAYMFGDAGHAHITQCRHHPHILAFGWECG